jgi:prepilin-type N-terminal cleavage/methylation domain-containing protein
MDQRDIAGRSQCGAGGGLGKYCSPRGERGLSLIELMVALTLLSLGFMGVIAMFPLGSQTVAESGMRTAAIELAQQGLECLMDLPYTAELLDPSTTHSDTTSMGEMTYVRRWDVYTDIPFPGCKQIVCTVIWDEAEDSGRLSLTTVIARAGRN